MILNKKLTLKYAEHFIVLGIWLVVFTLPLVILKEYDYINWNKVTRAWERIIPFFILFLINHYVLVPYLLFKRKRVAFFSIAGLMVVFIFFHSYLKFEINRKENQVKIENRERPPRPLGKTGRELPPPKAENRYPEFDAQRENLPPRHPVGLPPYLNGVLISLFILGFDTGLRIALKWNESEREKSNLEKENVQNQLAFLKHQVSPHFFMNTLNNIHSLIDIDAEEAKEAIIKLSKLMRYLLYDSDGGKVLLTKEIEFIQSYVNLMRLRFSEKVKINLNLPQSIPNKKVHPMLFISLIENAFKHGISYQEESFIYIDMLLTESTILFEIKNSKPKNKSDIDSSGVGTENTRKRLDLLYSKSYVMNINENNELYIVSLTIPF